MLRTAYLLTHDHALAEDLLQTVLTKAWFAWDRIEGRARSPTCAGGDVASIGPGLFSGPDAVVVLRRSGDDESGQAAVVTYVRVD